MICSKAEIRMEVEKLHSNFKDEEIFKSPYFSELMYATIESVCNIYNRLPKLNCICNPKSDLTASTNGDVINLNTLGPLIKDLPSNWKKFVANIGHVVHECGHVLYTDFVNSNNQLDYWMNASEYNLLAYLPKFAETETFCKELASKRNTRNVYCQVMRNIRNCIEDAYIEEKLREDFDGLAVCGLFLVNKEIYLQYKGLNQLLEQVEIGNALPLQVLDQMYLVNLVCKEKNLKIDKSKLTEFQQGILSEVNLAAKEVKGCIERLISTQDGIDRTVLYNILFIKLFKYMPDLDVPKSKEEGSRNDNKENEESSKSLDEQMDNLIQRMEEQIQRSGRSKEAEGNTSPVKSITLEGVDTGEKIEQAENLCNCDSSMERELQEAIKNALKEEAVNNFAEVQRKDLGKEAKEIAEKLIRDNHLTVGKSTFDRYTLIRKNVGARDKFEYLKDYALVKSHSNALVRKINNILEDREEESFENGLLMGQKFNAKDVVNGDGKYFSREIVPDGKPNLVFGLLIDESGSMARGYTAEDQNSTRARKVAILFEDVLRNLNIPQIVVGHTEYGVGEVVIKSYVDFDTKDDRDRYRLSGIRAEEGNIDGAAIGYIGEKLLNRPEETKVLIVISDGLPAGTSFWNTSNEVKDTICAIKHYRKKGIKVFGAVVDCYESVSNLYGEEYSFDCREGKALEQQFIRLIKRFVLAK